MVGAYSKLVEFSVLVSWEVLERKLRRLRRGTRAGAPPREPAAGSGVWRGGRRGGWARAGAGRGGGGTSGGGMGGRGMAGVGWAGLGGGGGEEAGPAAGEEGAAALAATGAACEARGSGGGWRLSARAGRSDPGNFSKSAGAAPRDPGTPRERPCRRFGPGRVPGAPPR